MPHADPFLEGLEPHQYILEKYQGFSAELVRLSLAGIAGVGFLITTIGIEIKVWPLPLSVIQPISCALILFGISTAFGLVHRFISTDALACHFSYVRKKRENSEEAEKERVTRNSRFKFSGYALWGSAITICAGAISLIIGMLAIYSLSPTKSLDCLPPF